MTDKLEQSIRKTYCSKQFWEALDQTVKAGPFDGGCLVCALALNEAAGEGEIVRIVDETTGITHHYGLRIGGTVYDFDGSCNSRTWVQRFARNENISGRPLSIMTGIDQRSSITNNRKAVREIAKLIAGGLQTPRKEALPRKALF